MRRICFLFLLLILAHQAMTQEVPPPVEQQLEQAAERLDDAPEGDQWLQELEHLRRHPLSINKATEEDLRTLRLLTDLQIQNLLQYRRKLGLFIDVNELQAVPGWDAELIRRLLPFVTVVVEAPVRETLKTRLRSGNHLFLLSEARVLEDQKGYSASASSRYLGSKDHVQFRYQYRYKNLLQMGLTGDKDAGEPFFSGVQSKGFDFYGLHFFARKLGPIKALALGDFTVNMGQGLVQWQSLAFGKGSNAINIKRQSAVLQPYGSAGEYNFNRGGGVTLQQGRVEYTVFASYRKLSGNRLIDTLRAEEVITSIQSSGYHRTLSEIEDRNHVGLTSMGGVVALKYPQFTIAMNGVRNHLSKSLQKADKPYNLFAINGKEWSNYSIDYSYTYRNVHPFGELAIDPHFHRAFIQGVLASMHAKADVALLYRNIDAAYQSFSGSAFTENSMPTNERGLYMGMSLRPHPFYSIDASADFYRFPWLKYRVDAPSAGRDYSVQLTYRSGKRLEVYSRYRSEQKMLNTMGADSVRYVALPVPRHNWRLHLDYQAFRWLELRARTELVFYRPGESASEKGFSSYVEGVYRAGTVFSCNLRLHYFSSDSYNSRIYAYESDLLYNYYIPAFYDTGLRYYIRVNWDAGRKISFWFRWSQTIYNDLKIIGSGLDQIEGHSRSEGKLQVRIMI